MLKKSVNHKETINIDLGKSKCIANEHIYSNAKN